MKRRDFLQSTSMAGAGLILAPGQRSAPSYSNPDQAFQLRYRQVHLDFHTSELIEDIASQFDPTEFAQTLKKSYVDSVTVFGRCHHGMIYYDTDLYPERRHPYLRRNLLKEQIEACHRLDIRTPIYLTVQWDHFSANQHPEWILIDDHGKRVGTEPYQPGFYREMDVDSPYRDFLKSHIAELFEKVPVDGLFLDIVRPRESSAPHYIQGMLRKKLDPTNPEHRLLYATNLMEEFRHDLSTFIRKLDKNCSIFYNGGHISPDIRNTLTDYSHLELESLPSGGWGYMHFPLTGRYARTLGTDLLGMTGKFHTSWGDFHSLKNLPALQYECFTMLALNAKCSIGDQLHPKGKLDRATYDLIGKVYEEVARKEAWCKYAKPVVEIGVFSPEASDRSAGRVPDAAMGVVRMLQEGRYQFDVIDATSDWTYYKLLIMPDIIEVDEGLKAKLERFVASGGALIASHKSGLKPNEMEFASGIFGVEAVGEAPYSPDFIQCQGAISKGLSETELVMYLQGLEVKATDGAVLANATIPYFNRTYQHFVSHRHTPSTNQVGYPAVVQKGKVIYFMHPIFTQYGQNAPLWCKKLVLNAVESLLPDALIKVEGPSTILTALNEQKKSNRLIVHLLHYIAERRGKAFDVIEEVIPLYNLKVEISTNQRIKKVLAVPEGTPIPFKQTSNKLGFVLPKLGGHQMIELTY